MRNCEIEVLFEDLLNNISTEKSNLFSGIGLLLYENFTYLKKYHCSLNNAMITHPKMHISSTRLMNYLIEISSYHHAYHDGFHFINNAGYLTHLSQFLSPPVNKKLINVITQGARKMCSLHGSSIKGVLMIGTISSKKELYLFKKGSLFYSKKLTNSSSNLDTLLTTTTLTI